MKQESEIYGMPNMGCMLGTAYHCLTGQLADILETKELEISVPGYMILRSLYFRDGMQLCEISEMVGKNKGVVSRTVKEMTKQGLIRTEQVSHKCLRVFLTPKAESIRETVFTIAAERQQALENLLGPERLSVFSECLRRIIKS